MASVQLMTQERDQGWTPTGAGSVPAGQYRLIVSGGPPGGTARITVRTPAVFSTDIPLDAAGAVDVTAAPTEPAVAAAMESFGGARWEQSGLSFGAGAGTASVTVDLLEAV